MDQIFIAILSGLGIWLVARTDKYKKWGYIFGIASTPFWIYSSLKTHQWGIFALSLWFAYSWAMGIYNYWIKK